MRFSTVIMLVWAFIEASDGSDSLFKLDSSTITGLVLGTDSDVLLVTQNSSVSLFKLSGNKSITPERVGRFPAAPDNSSFLTVAHVINDTHFIYCGERRCR